MAQIVKFRNQQIGDLYIKAEPSHELRTPPAVGTGLFADTALLNADSRNLLYQELVFVAIKRSSELAFNAAVSAIMAMQGQVGTLQIMEGVGVLFTAERVFMNAPKPDKLSGFGGRFIAEWPLLFAGSSPGVYY